MIHRTCKFWCKWAQFRKKYWLKGSRPYSNWENSSRKSLSWIVILICSTSKWWKWSVLMKKRISQLTQCLWWTVEEVYQLRFKEKAIDTISKKKLVFCLKSMFRMRKNFMKWFSKSLNKKIFRLKCNKCSGKLSNYFHWTRAWWSTLRPPLTVPYSISWALC